MNPEHTNGRVQYFYEDIHTKDGYSLGYTQLALMIWKEDSSGIRVIKDRFGGCISRLETEEELKEFMWIKLKSQKL
jgi:ribosomal protein S3AE